MSKSITSGKKRAAAPKRGQFVARSRSAGVVRSCVHASSGPAVDRDLAPASLVEAVRSGLAVSELDDLQTALGVPIDRLAPMLGISKATLHRRKAGQLLGAAESDRVVRFARLMGRAIEVFDSEEAARRWLNSRQIGLGGEVPLAYAQTEVGAREVENLLGRIEFGAYS